MGMQSGFMGRNSASGGGVLNLVSTKRDSGTGIASGLGGYGSALTALGRIAEQNDRNRTGEAEDTASAEAQARLAEQEAALDASARERKASRDAAGLRLEQQRARSRSLASLGANGLALSGSPLMALQGRGVSDEIEAAKVETEGQLDADAIRRRGATEAARWRRGSGSSGTDLTRILGAADSLLSQGGSPWRTGGLD